MTGNERVLTVLNWIYDDSILARVVYWSVIAAVFCAVITQSLPQALGLQKCLHKK